MTDAHLTSDMLHVDADGHREHAVARKIQGPATPGRAAEVTIVCSCGTLFRQATGPKPRGGVIFLIAKSPGAGIE